MIIVTGAAGFIGSCMVNKLNNKGFSNLVLADDFSSSQKENNYSGKTYKARIEREGLFVWLDEHHQDIEFIFHLGARTDTTEMDKRVFDHLNLNFSKRIWDFCAGYGIPLIYASSAATYGAGEHGYLDDHGIIPSLKPLNPYGESKNDFDKWALQQKSHPPFWAGMKFFNVFGPNEYHKGRMASVILHAYRQIKSTGALRLFRSHKPEFADGEQARDFIYVKDVVDVLFFMMLAKPESGIYNLGTGKARSFLDLGKAVFNTLGLQPNIQFIDTPADIRDKYQYFTQASMVKLQKAGYTNRFFELEEAVDDYILTYLSEDLYY